MKIFEVIRPSDRSKERAKQAAKEEAMRKRVVQAYTRALTAPQYKPHPRDVEHWLFGGGPSEDTEAMEELKVWTDAIGFMVKVKVNDTMNDEDKESFRTFSQYLDIPHDMVDFVCNEGQFPEAN
jgi:hypothetical protein